MIPLRFVSLGIPLFIFAFYIVISVVLLGSLYVVFRSRYNMLSFKDVLINYFNPSIIILILFTSIFLFYFIPALFNLLGRNVVVELLILWLIVFMIDVFYGTSPYITSGMYIHKVKYLGMAGDFLSSNLGASSIRVLLIKLGMACSFMATRRLELRIFWLCPITSLK